MAQVPMRMAQPALVPPHQQRPPMMVSMTQPPPVSMQVSMAPIMGPGGGMAVMTQAMSHPDSGHDHHHTINAPYHPHHHHHHQHPPPHAAPPRPHAPPQGHLPGPPPHHPSGPPHHPSGPPQPPHSAPPPSQYPSGPMHHTHGPHSVHHPGSHSGGPHSHSGPHSNSGGPTHSSHGHPQGHIQAGPPPHLSQPQHPMTRPSGTHQISGMKSSSLNMGPPHHQNQPSQSQPQPPSTQQQQQQHHHHHHHHHHPPPPPPPPPQQPQPQPPSSHQAMHQQMPHAMQQSQPTPSVHHQHPHHSNPPPQHSPMSHAVEKSSSAGVIILNSNSSVSNGPLNITESSTPSTSGGPVSSAMVNGIPSSSSSSSNSNGCDVHDRLSTREKTPMCLINELARFNKIQHQYCLTDEKGPAHKKTFTVSLRLGDGEEEYSASGPSIKKAQHSAAALALEKTKFKHPPLKTQKQNKQTKLTPTVELNALAMKRGEAALYTFMETPRSPNPYTFNFPPNLRAMYNQKYYGRGPPLCPMFFVSLRVGSREFVGEGTTAQQAKHNAASKALKVMKSLPLPDSSSSTSTTVQPDLSELDPNADLKSPISLVHEIALKRNLTVTFEVVRESGPPHMRTFVTTCIVGDVRTQGEGTGKKVSKKRAAELMLEELKKLPPVPSTTVTRTKRKPTTKKKSRNLIKVGDEEQKAAPEYGQGINPISRLIQIQQAKKEKEPIYTLVAERGVPRRREFVMQVAVGGQSAQGSGPNKKLAKRAAAENMLQLLGYSRPQPQPGKPAIKMDGSHSDSDKTRKSVTFLEETTDSSRLSNNADGSQNSLGGSQPLSGGSGRQLVPGLIMMPDGSALHGYQQMQQNGINQVVNMNQMVNMKATAAIAKELLESGSSPTAKALSKKQTSPSPQNNQQNHAAPHHMVVPQNMVQQQQQMCSQPLQQRPQILSNHRPMETVPSQPMQQQPVQPPPPSQQQPTSPSPQPQQQTSPQPQQQQMQIQSNPTNASTTSMSNNMSRNGLIISGNTSGQAVRPKEQLMYLANILNLQVQFTDFPKGNKSEYLSLVSLSTMPPHVSHGAGPTIDASHDQACLTALRALAEMGLDSVTSANADNSKT